MFGIEQEQFGDNRWNTDSAKPFLENQARMSGKFEEPERRTRVQQVGDMKSQPPPSIALREIKDKTDKNSEDPQ